MKKKKCKQKFPLRELKKLLCIMKLIFLFLLLSSNLVWAGQTYAQITSLNLDLNNVTLEEVFDAIRKQSEFEFFYNNDQVNTSVRVNVKAKNADIYAVLEQALPGIYEYKINDRYILVNKRKDAAPGVMPQPLQTKKAITGKITDVQGEPVIGVNIVEEGTTNGTVTDIDGNFSLTVEEGTILHISYIGYLAQKINTAGRTVFNIVLQEDTKALEEVVVIGYGAVRKSDLTGSVTSISADKLAAFPASGITQAMQGRAPGIQVTTLNGEPGAGTRVNIRGGTSLNAGNSPLYVVDGFAGGSIPPPEDIASIEILKDASATAIYGSRGANGVVLITTKSGQGREIKVEVNSSYSSTNVSKKIDVLNAAEFGTFMNEIYANSGSSVVPFPNPQNLGEGTNWQDLIFRTGELQNHQISISGGQDKIKFYNSFSYYGNDGVVINSNFKRYSGYSNLDYEIGKRFKVGTRMFFQRSVKDGVKTQEGSGGTTNTGVIAGALNFEPTAGIYKEDGTTYTIATIGDPRDNPYAVAMEYLDENILDQYQGNAYADVTILDGLTFRSTFGAQVLNSRSGTYIPTTLNQGKNVGGSAQIDAYKRITLLSENYFSYSKVFNDVHRFNAMAGYSYQNWRNETWSVRNHGFPVDSYLFWNLGAGSNPQVPSSGLTEWVISSFYGRLNYNFNDRYLFTFTGRYDGSSRMGKDRKWAFFPSGAFAWNMKQEQFMEHVDFLSQLKFRVSYGVTGNTDIGIYQSLANLQATSAVMDDNLVNAVRPSTVENAKLSWEETKQTDIGLDVGFLNGRISLTADYYIKETENLLYALPLPQYSGYSTSLQNIGSLENRGWEFGLNTVNFEGNFDWTTDFNIAFNRNKVTSLPAGQSIYSRRPGHIIGDDTHILTEGSPAGSFYGYIYDGVNRENGSPVYRDIAGRDANNNLVMEPDGKVDANDRTIIGNPHPDFIWGFNNTFSYKGFDLNIFFQGVVGNDMLNFTRMELEWVSGKTNQMKSVLNRWTPDNRDTDIPVASNTYSSIASSRWIEKGTYLRLKNVSLGYNIQAKALTNIGIDRLRIYLSGQNLWTLTDYTGYDPDVNYRDGNTSLGLDYGSYPGTRSFTLGFNLIF